MSEEIKKILLEMGKEARNSSQKLALASAEQKNQSLHYMAAVSYTHLTLPTILLV